MTIPSTTSASTATASDAASSKTLESWLWDAACSIRGAKDAPKYKDFILPLVFTKRLCDVFDDELNRIAAEVGSRAKAFSLVRHDKKLVRFYLPLAPSDPEAHVWSVIRTLSAQIGEQLTTHMRDIADANPLLKGIVDRIDFNATTHGQRDIDDDRLSNLIEAISAKRLGLEDVEPDIIGRSYEYLIRKFAEGSGKSAGEFYTPPEVAMVMARIMEPTSGMDIYDPCCGSAGLLIKNQLVVEMKRAGRPAAGRELLRLYGQENEPGTWAMANMNMIIHDMEGDIQIGDTFRRPRFRDGNQLREFDRVVANPMWNQTEFREADYDADELARFPKGAGFPGGKADWGWMQHILASLKPTGRAAVVLDTGAVTRGSGSGKSNKERAVRKWFIEEDLIEGVIYLPDNLFYNTSAPGVIIVLNRAKAAERRGVVFMINASAEFTKGDPKNFLSDLAVERIVSTFLGWTESDRMSRAVASDEIAASDFNLSPSRYIQAGVDVVHRPLQEIISDLRALEDDATKIDAELRRRLAELGI
jgi:type I restriction enzyme M protein